MKYFTFALKPGPNNINRQTKLDLDLLVHTTNHLVGAVGRLLHFHQLHQGVHLNAAFWEA